MQTQYTHMWVYTHHAQREERAKLSLRRRAEFRLLRQRKGFDGRRQTRAWRLALEGLCAVAAVPVGEKWEQSWTAVVGCSCSVLTLR